MKERERLKERRAITPVISALILSAVVLTVGGIVWAFSQSAMTISAEDYAESVINMTDTISERFIIEHVYYEYIEAVPEEAPELHMLHVFVYNYGTVDIEVKIEVNGIASDSQPYSQTYPDAKDMWIEVPSKDMNPIPIPLETSPAPKDELNIKAYTKRDNNVYYMYIVP